MSKIMNRKVLGVIALALVCVMAGTAIGLTRPAAQADTVVLTSPFTEAIAKVKESVVGVNNYQIVSDYGNGYNGYGYGYGDIWDFFNNPFGYGYGNGNGRNQQPETGREVKYGSGSGVVIAKEYVLTNYHVVEGAHSLKVSLGDENDTQYDATVAASDDVRDVAVLYVPGLEVEPVVLGDSDQLVEGDWVVNIGNAIGFTRTSTAGIVSALNRQIDSEKTGTDRYGRRSTITNTMIQTDAAINSGNSGGGMFNTAGELVGIPTLKYSGSRYSGAMIESIGMCIPINEAKPVIEEALKADVNSGENAATTETQSEEPASQTRNGRLGKPRLGVTVSTVTAEMTDGALPNGAYVSAVDENGPASVAGILPGDIIVEMNGNVLSSSDDLMNGLEGTNEGDTVKVTVWRPAQVGDAKRMEISTEGQYVENIEVKLAVLEPSGDM